MPTLKALWICPYLTMVDGITWRSSDHTATKMVKTLKGQPFNGYFEIAQRGTRRRFASANASEFLPTIYKNMARVILQRTQGNVTLVPIPNSAVTSIDHPAFRTKELAEGIASFGEGRLASAPLLVFDEAQPSSHSSGGSRDPHHFEDIYKITGTPAGQIVLVDDVLTTGAHLIGACWKLADHDCEIALASTWGRTTNEQLDPVWQVREEDLHLGRFTPDFDDI
jgi:hypothetical protein